MRTQTISLVLPRLHAAQRQVKHEAKRFNVLACGRRWGKTTLGVDLLTHPALGSHPVGWFAPTYKLLLEVWREFVRILRPAIRRQNATERRIELWTGGVLEFWTLEDGDAGRSRKYKRVFVDEAGLPASLSDTWAAAILPTLADLEGDAWLAGTPKGRGFFWRCYQRALSGTRGWACWQQPTHRNPHILPSEIDELRRAMPERQYRQEILAEFLEDGGGVFRRVAEAATLEPLAQARGSTYVGGVDWARSNDYTVFSIIDAQSGQQVALDRFSQVDYETQLNRFRAMHERFKVSAWVAEYNSMGGPLVERLQRDGYPVQPFVTTNATKAQAVDALALAIERGDVALLDDAVQTGELEAYEMTQLPSGAIRYSAPDGMHDDTVIALALAWHAAASAGPQRRTRRAA